MDILKNKYVKEGLKGVGVGVGVVYINPFVLGLVNNLTFIPQWTIYGISFPHGFISLGATAYALMYLADYLMGRTA